MSPAIKSQSVNAMGLRTIDAPHVTTPYVEVKSGHVFGSGGIFQEKYFSIDLRLN